MEKDEKKFLPIGTIVLLKGGKKELMITSYCIFPTGELYENGKKVESFGKMYEYGACTYPEGILQPDKIFGFNHDKIEKICHMGYVTGEYEAFTKMIGLSLEEIKNSIDNEELKVEQQPQEGQA